MNLDGLGNVPATTTAKTDWAAMFSQIVPAAIAARHQDKVMRENFKREKAGLPALDVDAYKPGVKVGLDKGTLVLIAAVVVAVLFYFMASRKR